MKKITLTKAGGSVTYDHDPGYVIATLRNGTYIITIKRLCEKRSVAQNDLMWAWLTCIESETGTPKEDIYLYYCKKFLRRTVTLGGKSEAVYETSSMLNTEEMTAFLNSIQADAAAELGISLPSPEERYFTQFWEEYRPL